MLTVEALLPASHVLHKRQSAVTGREAIFRSARWCRRVRIHQPLSVALVTVTFCAATVIADGKVAGVVKSTLTSDPPKVTMTVEDAGREHVA